VAAEVSVAALLISNDEPVLDGLVSDAIKLIESAVDILYSKDGLIIRDKNNKISYIPKK